jgi:hypothetical protein
MADLREGQPDHSISTSNPIRSAGQRGVRAEAVFLGFGLLAALPHLAIFYVVKNRVLPLLGVDWSEPKFHDNEFLNLAAGIGSLLLSVILFSVACRLSRWRTVPPWRWIGIASLYLLPAVILYLLPWIL